MTEREYLQALLTQHSVSSKSDEVKTLQARRKEVEAAIRNGLSGSPTIKYGGSHAKGTMIKDSFDLDLFCYLDRDDDSAGDTLEDIYNKVAEILQGDYAVQRKRCALRILAQDPAASDRDLHIDVVPGRFEDDDKDDVWLHVSAPDKDRLKTNPDKQIRHVKDSGLTDAIKLAKLWKHRRGLSIPTFVLELLVIDALNDKSGEVDSDIRGFWQYLIDNENTLSVKDPANPEGNDLSDLLDGTRAHLVGTARSDLDAADEGRLEDVFGPLEESDKDRKAGLAAAVAATKSAPKPWAHAN